MSTFATKVSLEQGQLDLRLFLDSASVELFINGGIKTMTTTIYPSLNSNGIELFSDGEVEFTITKWDICVK
ncbi:GH32 C-terminal domain-containing protein [Bacillus kwashiorkori]|uniref:GH32 C-terminal domain-containing protein n=1 Tax=Bacillus kwashiorkori TaxID=1522318 RepID=UPI001EF06DB8|nr:GH32 C-terminal domain-containing protein [Bacillus kwashiorkori]